MVNPLTPPLQVEISSQDIADALAQMAEKHRYREARSSEASAPCFGTKTLTITPQVLFMADTCQAATLAKHFYAPGAWSNASATLARRADASCHARRARYRLQRAWRAVVELCAGQQRGVVAG